MNRLDNETNACYLRVYDIVEYVHEEKPHEPYDEECIWWLSISNRERYNKYRLLLEVQSDYPTLDKIDFTKYYSLYNINDRYNIIDQIYKIGFYNDLMNMIDHKSITINVIDGSITKSTHSDNKNNSHHNDTCHLRIYDIAKYHEGNEYFNPLDDECIWWLTIGNETRCINYRILLDMKIDVSILHELDFKKYLNPFSVNGEYNIINSAHKLTIYRNIMNILIPNEIITDVIEHYYY